MFKIKEVDAKTTPRKKQLDLKNISVKDLKLIDTDTGEDITENQPTDSLLLCSNE